MTKKDDEKDYDKLLFDHDQLCKEYTQLRSKYEQLCGLLKKQANNARNRDEAEEFLSSYAKNWD